MCVSSEVSVCTRHTTAAPARRQAINAARIFHGLETETTLMETSRSFHLFPLLLLPRVKRWRKAGRCTSVGTGDSSCQATAVTQSLTLTPSFWRFFSNDPLTFQSLECVPFFPDTSHREERLWNDH